MRSTVIINGKEQLLYIIIIIGNYLSISMSMYMHMHVHVHVHVTHVEISVVYACTQRLTYSSS